MEECHRLLTDQVDLVKREGHRLVPDVSKPLPLGGLTGQKDFYITRRNSPSNRRAVRSHMQIFSVISIKTFKRYGYTFLRDIVIRGADYKKYKILEADFKNLHPNDFEDLYLLHLQEDYTIVRKPRDVIYRDRNDQKKMLEENEVHKFSDGTLTRVMHKLDHMVKDFRLYQYNPSME
nr:hypothetical protein [Tanacetum cinerariifolium]